MTGNTQTTATTGMKKSLSLMHYFFMGFGAIIGVGWIILVGDWMNIGGGPIIALLAFGFGALLLFPIGAAFGELSAAIPVAGGTVEFIDRAFGFHLSYIASWFLLLGNAILCPWESIALSSLFGELVPVLKSIPLYSIFGATVYLPTLIIAIVISSYIIYMNYRGVEQAAWLQNGAMKIIILGLLTILIISIIKGSPSNLMPIYQASKLNSSFINGFLRVLVITPFFYAGFDTIPQQAEEAEEGIDYRKFGAIIGLSLLAAGLFYIIVIGAYGSILPWKEFVKIPFPAFNSLSTIGLSFFGKFMLIAAICGIITTLNAFFIASTRIMVGMSRKGQLPAALAKLHATNRTPINAMIIMGVLTILGPLLGGNLLIPLTNVGSLSIIASCFLVACATLKLRFSEPDLKRPYKVPGGTLCIELAILTSAAILLLMLIPSSPATLVWPLEWVIVLVWMALGCIIMFFLLKHRPINDDSSNVTGRR